LNRALVGPSNEGMHLGGQRRHDGCLFVSHCNLVSWVRSLVGRLAFSLGIAPEISRVRV